MDQKSVVERLKFVLCSGLRPAYLIKASLPICFGIALASLATTSNAQSINCLQGGSNLTERTICQNGDLKYAAKEVERLWGLLKPADQQSFRPSQRDWLAKRNRCEANINCISNIYNTRNMNILETMDDGAGEG